MLPSKTNQQSLVRRSNRSAIKCLVLPFSLAVVTVVTLDGPVTAYLAGQLCGAVFLTQCFILVHELGHKSFFESKSLNRILGYVLSFFVFIPFHNWSQIHTLHHKWTGWRDKDPTTEKTFADRLSSKQEALINFCWTWYVPIFTLGYRFGIYWKAEKLKRHLSDTHYKRSVTEMVLYGALYLTTMGLFPDIWLALCPALYLSFVITDIVTLSQHSHIEMRFSNGEDVRPLVYRDQAQFSRSLVLPALVSRVMLFNFNMHEAHHVYPGVPCYRLHEVDEKYTNSYPLIPWLSTVKSMKGIDFVFRSSAERDGF
jgi:omega-6 fatty acid desaturase (delta-12 desaturase)